MTSLPPPDPPMNPDSTKQKDPTNRLRLSKYAMFLGAVGIHKFKMGNKRAGWIRVAISIAGILLPIVPGFLVMFIIGVIEGIKYRRMSDDDFERIYLIGKKSWF